MRHRPSLPLLALVLGSSLLAVRAGDDTFELLSDIVDTNGLTCSFRSDEPNSFSAMFTNVTQATRDCVNWVEYFGRRPLNSYGEKEYQRAARCVDSISEVVSLFSPAKFASYNTFTAAERRQLRACATDLTTDDRELAFDAASAILRSVYGCDTSEWDDERKDATKRLLTHTTLNVATVRSMCIVLVEGDSIFVSSLDFLKDSYKNYLRFFTGE